jgi:tetratricopeptide (TPR) repeat protein
MSLGELKDIAGLAQFGDKALAWEKPNARILVGLAGALADDPKGTHLNKAGAYARKAVELSKAAEKEENSAVVEGIAHSVLGYVLLRQDKYAPAVAELRTATTMLKDSPQDLAAALFRLGWAYAKMERAADATRVLTQASGIDSPFRQPAREMLAKIKAARR